MTKVKDTKYFLYGIYNIINGKLYIGIAADCKKRWRRHITQTTQKIRYAIHWALLKYGVNNFIFREIEELENWDIACKAERLWIKSLKELGYQLYNETDGGEGTFGKRKYGADNPNFGKLMKPHVKQELLKHRRKLTDEQIQEIQRLYAGSNYTQTKLSKQFNVSLTQIHRIVTGKSWGNKEHDAILTKKNMTANDAENIRNLYAMNNYTQKELAQQFNCSAGHIGKILRGEKWNT